MLTRPARESDMERIIVLHAAPYAFGILHATNLDHIKLDRLEAGNRFGRLSFTVDDSERHNRMARIFRIRFYPTSESSSFFIRISSEFDSSAAALIRIF